MRLRSAMFLLLLMPALAQAQANVPPTVTLRVRSLDTIIDNAKLIVSLAGHSEIAQQVEGLVKAKIGNKGLEGIDPTRPFGAYGRFGKELNDVSGVVLVPVADENAFIGLLENLNLKVEKNAATGLYAIRTGTPVDVSFRFANKYAYFSALNLDALNPAQLLPPDRVFPAGQTSALAANLRIDQLPEAVKFIVKAQIEQGALEAQDKNIPGETAAQKDLRLKTTRFVIDQFMTLITEGQELAVDINLDKASKELSLNFNVSGLPDTNLAKHFAELGASRSLFAGLKVKNAALHASATNKVPKELMADFQSAIDELVMKAKANIRDDAKRQQAEQLLNALVPTLKAGELDGSILFLGPDAAKHYSPLIAVKVKDGDNLGGVVRKLLGELVQQIPPAEQGRVKLDAETVAGSKIHRFDFGDMFDAKAKEVVGAAPIFAAFRNDAFFLAVGDDAGSLLKQALANKTDGSAPVFQLEVSVARLAAALAKNDQQKAAMNQIFPAGNVGTVRIEVVGGRTLNARLTTQLSVVSFIGMVATLRKAHEQ